MPGIGLLYVREACKVLYKMARVKAPLKDPGVGHRTVRTVGVRHAMQREGRSVEVAIEADTCGVDETLVVIGGRSDGLLVEVGGRPDGFEVDVEDGVGLGQKSSNLWGSMKAQEEQNTQRRQQGGSDQQRVT